MKNFNNELIVRRNESFTIDRLLQNKDKSPYIISDKLENPYFLITVTSTNYDLSKRYVHNYWLDLSDFPRFSVTKPEEKLSGWDDLTQSKLDRVYEYQGEYKYYTGTPADTYPYGWKNYECRIVKSFLPSETSKWVDQSYLYSIRLVSGVKTENVLLSLWDTYIKDNIPSNWKDDVGNLTEDGKRNMYKALFDNNEDCVKNIRIDYPIQNIDFFIDILEPTKLTVLSDLIGGING